VIIIYLAQSQEWELIMETDKWAAQDVAKGGGESWATRLSVSVGIVRRLNDLML